MPIKKSELYSALWKSCDELRGGMDASQYKDYVLVLLFVKYVSDKYAGQKGALLDVPKGGRFADMVALKGDKEIGDKMNKIISKLAEANDLKGVIDVADFNDADKLGKGKEMVDRLSNLVSIFDNPSLDFSANRAEGDDLMGDAYEFLMRHFATESGKSKGQFYTPAEVSRVMARVVGVDAARMSTPRRKRPAKKPAVPVVAPKRGALAADIRQMIEVARQQVAQAVNAGLTTLYWQIGARIRQDILRNKRAEYGAEIVAALPRQLGWTHSNMLIPMQDALKCDFYAEMCRVAERRTRLL